MRFFVALAFACGTLATAVQVQPLRTAAETHDTLSSEPDVQGAGFGIETAPEMAGLKARDEEPRKSESLNKRKRPYVYLRNVMIPHYSNDGGLPDTQTIDFHGVSIDFMMAKREIEQGNDMTTRWDCAAILIINTGQMRRFVTVDENVTAGTRVSVRPLFRAFISRRTVQVVEIPQDLLQFELGVTSVPGDRC
ncbi:hypothetical protein E4U57_002068 [Claviceps arundinis]|uniref:Uncharacterized protein n=1 Tax=Claviceps arundinis TaxID=1623583 RepID=A0ABQ7P9L6_9HYPO|nr:hypothetical protein E4U57_002068 [Claviceps arundinis]